MRAVEQISDAGSIDKASKTGFIGTVNPLRGQMVRGPWHRWRSSQQVKMQTASGTVEDLVYLRDLIEEGKLVTVIDRSYPLEEIVESHRYVETGAKIGNVVITIAHDDTEGKAF